MANTEIDKPLKIARILYLSFFIAIIIYLDILRRDFIAQFFSLGESTLRIATVVLIILGIVVLAYGYFLPTLMIKAYRKKPEIERTNSLLSIILVRAAMFGAIAVYGLTLGILGVSLQIVWPFFLVSVLALLISFPTRAKLERMVVKISEP